MFLSVADRFKHSVTVGEAAFARWTCIYTCESIINSYYTQNIQRHGDVVMKRLEASQSLGRRLLMSYFLICLLISHIIIPYWNNYEDFLFYSRWDLYGSEFNKPFYDLKCEAEEGYLIRDRRTEIKAHGISVFYLWHTLSYGERSLLKKNFLDPLQSICSSGSIQICKIEGPLYAHFLFKDNLSSFCSEEI